MLTVQTVLQAFSRYHDKASLSDAYTLILLSVCAGTYLIMDIPKYSLLYYCLLFTHASENVAVLSLMHHCEIQLTINHR